MSHIKIAILEPSRSITLIKQFYTEIFSVIGYDLDFFVLTNMSGVGSGNYGVFESELIDVFISDLSLGKIDSYDGLIVIKKIKQRFPNILIIANSYTNVTYADTVQQVPGFDIFVYKPKMHDKKYKEFVVNSISKMFKRNIYLDSCSFNLMENGFFSESREILVDMLKLITFTSHKSKINTAVTAVDLKYMKGGFSGSEVYKMSSYTKGGLKCINSVLKISEKKHFEEEMENYLSYIKWYLPYTWRPELIGFAEARGYGALCYSFVYNNEIPFKSLGEYVEDSDYNKLLVAINKVFSPDHQRWYHVNNVKKENGLTSYYFRKWFDERPFDNKVFCSVVECISKKKDNCIDIDGVLYQLPAGYLLGNNVDLYHSCICHGDLNVNNILMTDDESLTFIDFQKTGRGHVFDDFVTLEASIRIIINFGYEFKENIEQEYALNTDSGIYEISNKSHKLYDVFRKLRHHAFTNIPQEDKNNYYYALALFCFRLLRISNLEEWQQKQIVSCLLSCERVLSEKNYF